MKRLPCCLFRSLLGMTCLLLAGCGGRQAGFRPQAFPAVRVPGMYAGNTEAAIEYALTHFWDGLTDTLRAFPCDSMLVSGVRRADVEKNFANFTGLLCKAEPDVAKNAVRTMFRKAAATETRNASSNVFETLMDYSQQYLYDPNSPLRNEDFYGVLAALLANFEGFSIEKRAAFQHDAEMCSLNTVGTRAADFAFCDAHGRDFTLYEIQADYTLLFFSNPGCAACKEIIDQLNGNDRIRGIVADGKLAVVNIYIDEDLEAWYDYMPIYPKAWYNGYDPYGTIRTDTLYNVRAIPSLYLLDGEKTVLLKDAPENKVFEYLATH